MIIICYRTDGIRYVATEEATRHDFSRLYRRWKRKAEEDGVLTVWWHSPTHIEIEDDRLPYVREYRLRPDDWPVRNAEPD